MHTNHNPTMYSYLPFTFISIMGAYPGHILESLKGIEI